MKNRNSITDHPDPRPYQTAEKMLWRKVLWLAVLDAAGHAPAVPHGDRDGAREAAWEWIDAEGADPGGFAWVCRRLDLDLYRVRNRLEALDHEDLTRSQALYYFHRRRAKPSRPVRRRRTKGIR